MFILILYIGISEQDMDGVGDAGEETGEELNMQQKWRSRNFTTDNLNGTSSCSTGGGTCRIFFAPLLL